MKTREPHIGFVTACMALVLAGCGGGGGSATDAPATLPASLSLSAPAQAEPGVALDLGSDLGEGRTGLSFSWDFGDGSGATQARPAHSYAVPGRYTVTLSVTNAAGQRISAQAAVQVGRFAMVRDRQCAGAAGSGWCWQSPQPDGMSLADVFFLDAQRGWAVGEGGRVWASTDGGEHWQRLPDVAGHSLTRVAFVDADNGWALSDVRARLARTRDGGRSWQTATTPDADDIYFRRYDYLFAVNRDTAVAVGSANMGAAANYSWEVASITTDGGATWRRSALPPNLVLPDGSLWQTRQDFVNGRQASKSTDLGLTHQYLGLPWGSFIWVASPQDVWSFTLDLLGRDPMAYVYRSGDGGLSFEHWPFLPPSGISAFRPLQWMVSPLEAGWAIDGLTVLRTEDGAKTWSRVATPADAGGSKVQSLPQAIDPDSLWTQVDGQLQFTDDGGRHWRTLANPDESVSGYSRLQRDPAGALRLINPWAHYRSADGGRHWWPTPGSLRQDLAQTRFVGLGFTDALHGLALAEGGAWFDTADGGRQWQRRTGTAPVCHGSTGSLQFTGGGQGWALVNGCLMRSADQGRTWVQAARPDAMAALSALRFHGPQRGWAVGTDGQGFATTDGGQTWQASDAAVNAVLAVAAADGSTLWRIGTSGMAPLARSSDGGANWQAVDLPASGGLRATWFVDARTGWVVGEGGLVLATSDGGQTWQRQASGSASPLYAVFALDAATVWVAGERGTVLATATGGR